MVFALQLGINGYHHKCAQIDVQMSVQWGLEGWWSLSSVTMQLSLVQESVLFFGLWWPIFTPMTPFSARAILFLWSVLLLIFFSGCLDPVYILAPKGGTPLSLSSVPSSQWKSIRLTFPHTRNACDRGVNGPTLESYTRTWSQKKAWEPKTTPPRRALNIALKMSIWPTYGFGSAGLSSCLYCLLFTNTCI